MEKSYFTKREREILKVRSEKPTIYGITERPLSKPLVIVHYSFGDSYYSIKTAKTFIKKCPEHFSEVVYSEVEQMY